MGDGMSLFEKPRLSVLGTLYIVTAMALSINAQDCPFRPITSDSAAVAVAEQITGLGEFFAEKGYRLAVDEVVSATYVDTTTPYVHEQLNGRPAWRVSYTGCNWILDTLNCNGTTAAVQRNCDVWLDSASGSLLMVDIYDAMESFSVSQSLSLTELTNDAEVLMDVYLRLPRESPEVSMRQALSMCEHYPCCAYRTVVQYITMVRGESEPFPAWVINMRGCGFTKKQPENGIETVVSSRQVVNAMTGQCFPLQSMVRPAAEQPSER